MAFYIIAFLGFLFFMILKFLSRFRDTKFEVIPNVGSQSLVVLVHGLAGRKKFETTVELVKETLPNSELLVFDYDSSILSNQSPYDIANFMERKIHEVYSQKTYSEIVLVGYSMGGCY